MDPNQPKMQIDNLNETWLKSKIKTLWTAPQYCVLCLATDTKYYSLSLEYTYNEVTSTDPLRDVVNYVFNFKVEDYLPSDNICVECAEKTINTYNFIINTKKMYQILSHCVDDIQSKVNYFETNLAVDPKYENSNLVIVVQCDNETLDLMNDVTSGNNTVLTEEPIILKEVKTELVTTPNLSVTTKDEKENPGPVVIPTPRVEKHPRTKFTKKQIIKEKVPTPNVTLKEGKIVIEPLVTSNVPSTSRFNTYSCSSCTDIFTTHRSLKEHEKVKHNSVIFKCRYCVKIYNTQQYLDVHYLSTHGKSRCKFCKDLVESDRLNNHLKEMHHKLIYACSDCDLVYHNYEKLETHKKSSHLAQVVPVEGTKQCIMCLKNLKTIEEASHKCKFSCLECPKVPCIHYSYLTSYRDQVLNHSSMIRCIDCDYTTKRKEHLIGHVNREHLDYHPFTCDVCGTQFYTKLSLKTHVTQFHRDLNCEFCDTEFKSPELLQRHRQGCKLISRRYSCVKCVASFDTAVDLKKHSQINHSEFVYPCALCNKEFPAQDSLEEHHARVHSGIQYKKRRKIIECTLCDITFKNIKSMIEHEQTHSPDDVFPCKVCPKSFSNLKKIYIHKQCHYSQRTKCSGCSKTVASSYLIQHKALCPAIKLKESRIICEVCGKFFHLQSSLKAHLQMHNRSETCIHCHKMVKPASMKKHIELKHAFWFKYEEETSRNAQLLRCDDCDYAARKQADFENHVNKIHLKIKPYSCELCSRQFCGKTRLTEHMRTHSTTNSCFCTFCNKKFANKVCLKMHIRRHTGECPYECNICFEKFRSSSMMKSHRMKKHQDKTISCPLCGTMYHILSEMRFHIKKVHWKSSEPYDYKKIVPEEFHHLFQDRRLQKLGDESEVLMGNI